MHPTENLTAIPGLCLNFLRTMNFTITWKGAQPRSDVESTPGHLCLWAQKLAAYGVALIQAMVFSILLCPLAALYGFGQYITTAIALWRLIDRYYGTSGGGQTTNMNPALRVLYLLAVLQGAVFCYRGLLRFAGKRIASQVAQGYMFEQGDHSLVLGYLRKARIGCETDPSFVRGRNLITYALDLMESDSPDDLLSGTRILDTLITYDQSMRPLGDKQNCRRMPMVIERLVGSSSSRKLFQKLLKALDSRSPCDKEMRKHVARIVCAISGDIRLKEFPGGIECISYLLDASLHPEVNEYKELMLQGLLIIEKLARDEDNCRVMGDTNGLVSMVMRPLSCDPLHRFTNHSEWSHILDASLQVLCTWLNTATGNSGEKLCSQIAGNKEAISTMETILTCPRCHERRLILAMKVLITQIQDQENIIVQLRGIFLDYTKDKYVAGLAGEKLVMLSKESKSNAKIILEANDGSVERILRLLSTHRNTITFSFNFNVTICAAGILEGLCSHYITSPESEENDPCFENLKKIVISKLPELLIQMCRQQHGTEMFDRKLQAALFSLCFTAYHKMINAEDGLRPLLDAVCSKDPQFNLPKRLGEIVERDIDYTAVDCLRIVKYTAKMAKSMMRHKHIYSYKDLEELMNSLGKACTLMFDLDAFVHLSGADGDDTLASLMQEAHELFCRTDEGRQPEISNKGKESEITEPSAPSTTFEHGQSSSS